MESLVSFPLQALALATLSLVLLYASFKMIIHQHEPNKSKNKKNNITNKICVPEPSGALPIIGHLHLLGGQVPVALILGAMADKYGPIYSLRLGQHRALVLSSWELVKECFTTNDRLFANRPSIAIGKYIFYDGAAFAISSYGNYWRDVRKMVTLRLLSSHRLESLQHIRASEVDKFIKGLYFDYTKLGLLAPLSELLEELTFNINARLIVGKSFIKSAVGDADTDARRIKKAIMEALYLSGVFVWSDAIPWVECLDIHGHVSSMKRVFKEIDLVLGKWLEEHRQAREVLDDERSNDKSSNNGDVERDLMEVMLSSIEEDDAMLSCYSRDTIIKATALILLLTGAESTAVTLIWTISLLLNNPSIMKAAQRELDTHVGRDRWVQESDLSNLKFLSAIVKETVRLYPPGPITGPREATEECFVGGHHVPKGTRLIVNIWKLHRDPRMWADPCEFRPERFMTTHEDLNFRGQNFQYIPFSSGRRSCPGMTLGLLVVELMLARLVQGFEFKTKDDKPVDMREGLGLALPKLNSLDVFLYPRLPTKLYECL